MPNQLDWLKPSAPAQNDVNVQGSAAWLAWRNKGLGSSDAAVLLGWSPWKTIDQLLAEKRGTWKPEFGEAQQRAMNRGKDLESVIRKWYEHSEHSGSHFFPDAIAEDSTHPFMRASFDGLCRDAVNSDGSIGRMIEIKAPNAKDHELAKNGHVPEKYIPQVQWLMMIGKLPWADYVSYGTDDTYAVVHVRADHVIMLELRARAIRLWEIVHADVTGVPPIWGLERWQYPAQGIGLDLGGIAVDDAPPVVKPGPAPAQLLAAGHFLIIEQETEALCERTLAAQAEAAAATARYEALKEILKEKLGDRKKAHCGEAVLEWQDRKGAVDYGKIPELKNVDLEKYRKKPTRAFLFHRISET